MDFDAAAFNHVPDALGGGKLAELDEDDAAAVAAVARLREECVQAKEALSSDTDTSIPVLLPNVVTEVRLTRSELEAMVRIAVYGSVEALKRALRSAGCTPEQLHSVVLVGGSTRMPLVAQLVSSEFGRPVAVDAHPEARGGARGGVAGQQRPAGAGEHRHGRSRHGSEPARAPARPAPPAKVVARRPGSTMSARWGWPSGRSSGS